MISIEEIFGQDYEWFMMELEDLKLWIQEDVIKQVNEAIKWYDMLIKVLIILDCGISLSNVK